MARHPLQVLPYPSFLPGYQFIPRGKPTESKTEVVFEYLKSVHPSHLSKGFTVSLSTPGVNKRLIITHGSRLCDRPCVIGSIFAISACLAVSWLITPLRNRAVSIMGRPNRPDSSPCIGICSHNTGGNVCRGCGRTVAEVRDWLGMSSAEKIEVKGFARARLAKGQLDNISPDLDAPSL